MSGFITKGVPVGRPFCLLKYQFWLIFAFIYFLPFSLYAQTCGPDRVDEKVQYTYVYDGDTIELKDGRKLRFIGINTPEIGHNESPPQPYAVKARKVLISLLAHNKTLQLRFDAERHDKYNRLLAHVFLSDGSSVAARLLEQGLATTLVIPPNVWNQTCYSEIEHKAMAQKKGLWSLPEYQPVDAAKLTSNHGYQIVRGRVKRIGKSKKSIWLNLNRRVALRIDKKDLIYFNTIDFDHLKNHNIIARGWIHSNKGELNMRIHHPAALEVLN